MPRLTRVAALAVIGISLIWLSLLVVESRILDLSRRALLGNVEYSILCVFGDTTSLIYLAVGYGG